MDFLCGVAGRCDEKECLSLWLSASKCSESVDFQVDPGYFLKPKLAFPIVVRCALPSDSSNQVTVLLARWNQGEDAAREELVPLVYEELRRVARKCLAEQHRDHTLQSTALVHEAYLRLVGRDSVHWQNRVHFFAVAARLMRGILVDHARKRNAAKRGGGAVTLVLDEKVTVPRKELNLVALDHALTGLAGLDSRQSQIVELRFFGGLSIEDVAHVLRISPATVKREWATARLWLHNAMGESASI
jgi:RNA polymerase sigma factor (TIGR02999 family)